MAWRVNTNNHYRRWNRRWPGDNYLYPGLDEGRWSGFMQGQHREPWQNSLEDEIRARRPIKINIVGHSFICHLITDTERRLGQHHNWSFEYDCVQMKVIAESGMSVSQARYQFLNRITCNRPDIIYLELGTCDLAEYHLTPWDVQDKMMDLVNELGRLGAKMVIIGEVIPRRENKIPEGVGDFNYKVNDYNRLLNVEYDEEYQSKVLCWRHKGLWESKKEVYKDGLHLNKLGHLRLFRSIRSALLKGMWKMIELDLL